MWTTPGLYDVGLLVEDEDGSTDSTRLMVTVIDVAPTADAGGPYEVDEGALVTLDGSGSAEPGDDIVEYAWDLLDDGQRTFQEYGPLVEWTWVVAGEYRVALQVTDADGSEDMVYVNVTVRDLVPTFNLSMPEDVREGVRATFELLDLADPGTARFQVVWGLGDGTIEEGTSVTHTFLDQGSYRGNVSVMDNDGIVHYFELPELQVENVAPILVEGPGDYILLEDEPFVLQLKAYDTSEDTVTFAFEGPGGKIDPETGTFTWTPRDEHVGKHRFQFIVRDEDGGEGAYIASLDVQDVDNDFIGGMSTAGGSALILLLVIAVLIVAILYMRYRGGRGTEEDDDVPGAETLAEVPPPSGPDVAPAVAPPPAVAPAPAHGPAPAPDLGPVEPRYADVPPLPDGAYVPAGAAATGEAASDEADQLPPPPPPPAGPQFNQVLEDRASESEVQTDDETEVDASEWEVIE